MLTMLMAVTELIPVASVASSELGEILADSLMKDNKLNTIKYTKQFT